MDMQPFGLQAPEYIAKEYDGNKAQIAKAVQMGLVDPTSALLAGMFIDRMRTAQYAEQTPNTTVAQDVLYPMVPGAAEAASAPMPSEGVAGLPVPDTDFADGGIVAFAAGSPGQVEVDARRPAAAMEHYIKQYMRKNRSVSREEAERIVRSLPHSELQRLLGNPVTDEIPSLVDLPSLRVLERTTPPDPEQAALKQTQPSGLMGLGADPEVAKVSLKSASEGYSPVDIGQHVSFDNINSLMSQLNAGAPSVAPDASVAAQYQQQFADTLPEYGPAMQRLEEYYAGADDRLAAQKKEDLWTALTQFGLNWAGSDSPYALQAAGQAGMASLPTLQQAFERQRAGQEQAMKMQADLENAKRAEQLQAHQYGLTVAGEMAKAGRDQYNTGIANATSIAGQQANAAQAEADLNWKKKQHAAEMAMEEAKLSASGGADGEKIKPYPVFLAGETIKKCEENPELCSTPEGLAKVQSEVTARYNTLASSAEVAKVYYELRKNLTNELTNLRVEFETINGLGSANKKPEQFALFKGGREKYLLDQIAKIDAALNISLAPSVPSPNPGGPAVARGQIQSGRTADDVVRQYGGGQ